MKTVLVVLLLMSSRYNICQCPTINFTKGKVELHEVGKLLCSCFQPVYRMQGEITKVKS